MPIEQWTGPVPLSNITSYDGLQFGKSGDPWYDVKAFGAKGDGVADDTAAIQAAITAANNANGGIAYFPPGTYKVTSTINLYTGVSLIGAGREASIIAASGTGFNSNAAIGKSVVFNLNVTLATNASTAPFTFAGRVSDLYFKNTSDVGGVNVANDLVCFNVGSPIVFEHFLCRNWWAFIYGATGYVDQIQVKDAYFYQPHNAGWQVRTAPLGDGFIFEALSFDQSPAGGGSMYLNLCRGGRIDGCIAATITLLECEAVTISNLHGEGAATVTFDTCKGCSLKDSKLFKQQTAGPSVIYAWSAPGGAYEKGNPNVLQNVGFMILGNVNNYAADVRLHSNATVRFIECFRQYEQQLSGDGQRSITMGIVVEDSTPALLPAFNQWSHRFSHDSLWEQGVFRFSAAMEVLPARAFRISGISTSAAPTWGNPSGTYYYTFDLISNAAKGPISSADSGESSQAVTNGGPCVLLTTNTGLPRGIILRFWRGTASGNYTAYADVPIFGGESFYDTGYAINGFVWQTTGLPTRIASQLTAFLHTSAAFAGWDSAAPTAGAWAQGDIVYNTAAAASGSIGWVCVIAGTPGTWKTFGAISA